MTRFEFDSRGTCVGPGLITRPGHTIRGEGRIASRGEFCVCEIVASSASSPRPPELLGEASLCEGEEGDFRRARARARSAECRRAISGPATIAACITKLFTINNPLSRAARPINGPGSTHGRGAARRAFARARARNAPAYVNTYRNAGCPSQPAITLERPRGPSTKREARAERYLTRGN